MEKPDILICPSCWAVYERVTEGASKRQEGCFECSCGYALASWGGKVFPKFIKLKEASKMT
jgi:hypothetical protein